MQRSRFKMPWKSIFLATNLLVMTQAKAIPISVLVPVGAVQGQTGFIFQNTEVYYTNSKQAPGVLDASFDIKANVLALFHAPSKDFYFFGILPHLNTTFQRQPNPLGLGFEFLSHTQDFGDPIIGFNYRLIECAGEGWLANIGITPSLGIPAAEYHKPINQGDTIPVPNIRILQAGKGNWNPNLAMQAFWENRGWMVAGLLGYNHYFGHDGFQWGSSVEYDLSLGRRIYPFAYDAETEYKWRLVGYLEFLGLWTDRAKTTRPAIDGLPDDSGGNLIKFAPGIKFYHLAGYEAGFQYMTTLSQHVNGQFPVKFSRQYLFLFGKQWA